MLIVSVKMGALASIDIHAGLYVFATAILLIMFLTQMTVKRFTPQTA
jgi:paraquat-inducible protein A